jgi:hypothetical protein
MKEADHHKTVRDPGKRGAPFQVAIRVSEPCKDQLHPHTADGVVIGAARLVYGRLR